MCSSVPPSYTVFGADLRCHTSSMLSCSTCVACSREGQCVIYFVSSPIEQKVLVWLLVYVMRVRLHARGQGLSGPCCC
jgi:hypothetical protein